MVRIYAGSRPCLAVAVVALACAAVSARAECTFVAESEPNDTFDQGQTISPREALIEGNILPADDVDVFRIPVSAGQRLWADVDVSAVTAGSARDATMEVLDVDGTTTIAEDDDSGTLGLAPRLTGVIFPQTGVIGLVIRAGNQMLTVQNYRLICFVTSDSSTDESAEPNDTIADAGPAGEFNRGTIESITDQDVWSFTASEGQCILVAADNAPDLFAANLNGTTGGATTQPPEIGLAGLTIELLDEDGTVLAISGPESPGTVSAAAAEVERRFLTYSVTQTGTYYVRVSALDVSDTAAGLYELAIRTTTVNAPSGSPTQDDTNLPTTQLPACCGATGPAIPVGLAVSYALALGWSRRRRSR